MASEVKNKNRFRKHWIIYSLILVFVVLPIIISIMGYIFSGDDVRDRGLSDNSDVSGTQEPVETCNPNWQCGEWAECSSSGTQTRTCTDSNNCGSNKNKPSESQSCTHHYTLEEILPLVSNFPTEYTRDGTKEIEEDNENLKVYDTNGGFVKGKKYLFSKYEVGAYSVQDYFDIEIMFYEFDNPENAINFKNEMEKYMEEQGGYSKIKLNTEGNCFNTKEDFGYSGGNIISSTCQRENIVYWTILSITNSYKDSENYIDKFIEVIEDNF